MEEEFLAENNACGQTLLHVVSRGNAIIAELLRLKDHIPHIFRLEKKQDQQKYGELILDFSYFNSSDEYDKKIENSEHLQKLDEEIYKAHGEILTRFYKAFESVHKYVTDLNTFVEELEEGIYIQQTLDTVFLSQDGIQLMCESIYVYGVMLLIVDLYYRGDVRERLVVAHSRHCTTSGSLDHVCQLIRTTGFLNSPSAKRPANYPQEYFRRVPLNEKLVNIAVGKLRTEDIYHQQKALPLPQQMTTALAQQAAVLFVALFFAPNILHNQTARMREIVDKYFPDNWIVNVYMGITINLIDMWEPFRAARIALANTLEPSNIRDYATTHASNLQKLVSETNEMLKEGVLVKKNLLDNVSKVLALARECNVTLRWLMLHTAPQHSVCETVKKCKQVRDQVLADTLDTPNGVLELLLNTAHFENTIRELFKSILNEREDKWAEGKKECTLRIGELEEVFAGTKPLMRVDKNENLKKWFGDIKSHISSLNLDEPNISARKIVQLIQALEEVQGYPQLTGSLQVKQLLDETCSTLRRMLSAAGVRDTVLVHMQIVGDFSYGWLLVDNYTQLMQSGVRADPTLVNKLRAVFLKLSSAMETSLLRINQAGCDGDLSSVSRYYSNQLVGYIKKLLQVIPETVFTLMAKIAHIQTHLIPELPDRLEKDKMKEYAQLEHRFEVAKLTHEVSVFSSGLLNMKATLVGIVRLDPKQLLEDGINKELTSHISKALNTGLVFNPKTKGVDLATKLDELGNTMDGHKRSFEYVQDYIGINGIKMWLVSIFIRIII
ncbi:hypothetical protein AAG570_013991 [Ranatra chinensis]|uniref:WASH complex subunit strumpellin n=1 Tax=Ranatra chinensis TaxID=642074 RepID=A0ABD0YDS9_9HEMI